MIKRSFSSLSKEIFMEGQLQRIFSSPNGLMSSRYETRLLVDVKIEELKFEGEKYKIYPSYSGKLK